MSLSAEVICKLKYQFILVSIEGLQYELQSNSIIEAAINDMLLTLYGPLGMETLLCEFLGFVSTQKVVLKTNSRSLPRVRTALTFIGSIKKMPCRFGTLAVRPTLASLRCNL